MKHAPRHRFLTCGVSLSCHIIFSFRSILPVTKSCQFRRSDHSPLQIRRENLAYMGNKNTNLDYFVPQITVFDHRGCSRPPKEYAGALMDPRESAALSLLIAASRALAVFYVRT